MRLQSLLLIGTLVAPAAACQRAESSGKIDELTKRIEKLEANQKDFGDVASFVRPIMNQQKAQEDQQAAQEPDPDARFAVSIANNAFEGPANAPVTVIEAFDFACPYCERVTPIVNDLVKEYKGKVRVVYKNFVVHPDAVMDAHLASCAASKQGKYLEFKNAFWEKGFGVYKTSRDPTSMNADSIGKWAGEIGLDVAKLQSDMKSEECKALITADMGELNKFGVNGTPAFFVNGKFTMFSDPTAFKAMLDKEIAEAEASGQGDGYYENVVMKTGEKKFRSKKDAKPKGG